MSPVTEMGDVAAVAELVAPPLLEMHEALYAVIATPPSSVGAVNAVLIRASPRVTDVMLGAVGEVGFGRNADDAIDAALVPAAFVAVTVQVYVLALVRPVTVNGEATPLAAPVLPPLLEVQVAV